MIRAKAALGTHLPQNEELRLRMLLDGQGPHVQGGAFHGAPR
jgi:hypothetical protein